VVSGIWEQGHGSTKPSRESKPIHLVENAREGSKESNGVAESESWRGSVKEREILLREGMMLVYTGRTRKRVLSL